MPDLRRIASPCPPAPCSAPSFAHTPTRATPSTPLAVAQLTHVPDTTGGRLHAALGVRVGERVKKRAGSSGLSHSNGPGLRDTPSDTYRSPVTALRLDHPFFEQLFVAQPQVRNVRRPQPQNILQRA